MAAMRKTPTLPSGSKIPLRIARQGTHLANADAAQLAPGIASTRVENDLLRLQDNQSTRHLQRRKHRLARGEDRLHAQPQPRTRGHARIGYRSGLHHDHRAWLIAFEHLGHPEPLARILAQGDADRIGALVVGQPPRRGPSGPARSACESQAIARLEYSRDCAASGCAWPGPRMSSDLIGQLRCRLCPSGRAFAQELRNARRAPFHTRTPPQLPNQPHGLHHFCACSLRGLYRFMQRDLSAAS